jgi:hypothetical protein
MSNQPAFLYSSVLTGWPNELNAKRYIFTPLNPIITGAPDESTECDCVGISMPNESGTLQVYSSDDGSAWTLRVTAPAYKMRNSMTFFDAVDAPFWYVQAVGFSSVAVIKLGRAVRMDQRNYQGVAPTAFNQSVNMTPQSMSMGQWLGRQAYGRTGGMSYQFDHTTATWIRTNAMTMIEALREGAGVFYAWRPDKYPQDVIYGHLSNPVNLTNTGTLSYMSGTIAIDGVHDGTYNTLATYIVTPPELE